MTIRRRLLRFAGCLVLAAVAACRGGQRKTVFPSAPVFLISVDTLRADHLPAYGYKGVATPHLDALRKDAILYENAYTHVPLTLPSHVALMTGMLPPQSGVRDNIGYRLGPGPETLAGFLGQHGYAAGGAVSSAVIAHVTGINRGFAFYDDDIEPTAMDQTIGRLRRDGGETADVLKKWMTSVDSRPFFAFFHTYDCHTPYEPPEPYRSRYPLAYDGAIARTDEVLGGLLDTLRQRGLYDRAVIVFLADHGEGLKDHGEEEHGVLLYRETIHVPLMIKLPGQLRAGSRVATPVALTDVFPTVARLLGLTPPAGLAGIPLITAQGEPPVRRIYSETLYPRLHLGWSDLASLEDDRYHYIEAPRSELYDLIADPAERNDLSAGLPPAFRSMRIALSQMSRPVQAPGSADPEQVKKLAALGYLSGSPTDLTARDLPDPKDRIGAVEELKQAFGELKNQRYEEAARLFNALVKQNPRMVDVWQLLAQADLKLSRDEEAHQALVQAAKLSPGNPQVLLALSEYFRVIGDFKQARQHAELARDAGALDARENLARIALAQGDSKTAETEARAALQEHPNRRIPHLILARVMRDQGKLPEALAEINEAVRLARPFQPPLFSLNYLKGDVLARLSRNAEARAAFLQEIQDFPDSAQAYTALAVLYASEGNDREARRTLENCLANARTPGPYFAVARAYEVLGDAGRARIVRSEIPRRFPGARERPAGEGG
jgi:arylsulfatase A-like enzyme/Flp pilus assembly protein TadD